jgi:hypothetical protein
VLSLGSALPRAWASCLLRLVCLRCRRDRTQPRSLSPVGMAMGGCGSGVAKSHPHPSKKFTPAPIMLKGGFSPHTHTLGSPVGCWAPVGSDNTTLIYKSNGSKPNFHHNHSTSVHHHAESKVINTQYKTVTSLMFVGANDLN